MNGDIIQTVEKLVKKSKTVVVSSVGEDGYPYQKAMYNARERDGIKTFYLSTNTSSLRASHYIANPKASLYFFDAQFHGVVLLGTMEVLQDAASKELIWHPRDTMYYPLGVTDPDYCVFRFTTESGRYYASFGSTDFAVEK